MGVNASLSRLQTLIKSSQRAHRNTCSKLLNYKVLDFIGGCSEK